MEIALIIVLLLLIALFFIRKQKAPKVINNSKNFKRTGKKYFSNANNREKSDDYDLRI